MTILQSNPQTSRPSKAGASTMATTGTQSTQRILVVDDESSISELIATSLKFVGFEVRTAASGSEALRVAEEFKPHALILDVMLPDQNGFDVCRQLRQDGHSVGVLFLTAKDTVEDKIAGLTIGGDDYVTKPFSLEELVARLRALLRRIGVTESELDDEKVRFADLELDEATHEVRRAGHLVDLSPTEFTLLRYLMIKQRLELSNPIQSQLQLFNLYIKLSFRFVNQNTKVVIQCPTKKLLHKLLNIRAHFKTYLVKFV